MPNSTTSRPGSLRVQIIVTLVAFFLAGGSIRAEMRTFTDIEGRTIQAELLEADATTIRIRRNDGVEFELERERLAKAEQAFIDEWIRRRAFRYGGIEISTWRVRLKSDRDQTKSSVRTTEEWCYRFRVRNESRLDFEDLTIEYRVFWLDDRANVNKEKLPRSRLKGTVVVSLAQREQTEFQTKTLLLQSTERLSGRPYAGTNKRRVEDELAGIWIRVTHDGVLLQEHASPHKLVEEEAW